jgi:hypothetical protein
VLGRPDAPVCPEPAEAHQGLRPFLDAAESLHAERWLDAGHDAARPVCHHHTVDAIPALLPALKAVGAGRLAVPAPRHVDAVLDPPASVFLKASHGLPLVFVAAEPCKQAAGRFAA